ncbi:cation/H(+) antiporter [Amycolatopsis acidicola]|uniref:Cation/H(+) antiporter n=1 Tax=Amycolatopsis acidicola TaxID=2596893 RepID=A0A5N0UZL4_9PSEU|nr:cation:proton antiporter [Amycolatopsis acidicola]KAA9159083.1 cation/H(+) antiporter [Amycolatopsis acidicola]
MDAETAARLVAGLLVIVLVARLLGFLAKKAGQPPVVGEILGGILLGPTLFHGAVTSALFPTTVRPGLTLLANIGVCVFMFLVGLRYDHGRLAGTAKTAATVALSAVALPFAGGAALAWYLFASHPAPNRLGFVLFMGTAMSVTAFPVLARILADKGLIDTPVGGIALAIAAVDDVLAWSLLAVVVALVQVTSGWQVLLIVPFAVVMLWVVRPLLARAAPADGRRGGPAVSAVVFLALAAGLFVSAEVTDLLGLHAFFGAFLFGVVMPKGGAATLRERVLPWVERVSSVLLLPVFFMVAGLGVDLSTMDGQLLGELGLVLVVAVGGKFGGAYLGARASGIRPRHATVLAALVNTRGLTELIALTVGLRLGMLDGSLYSLMVVMALVTTAMTGIVLRFVYPHWRVQRDHDADLGSGLGDVRKRTG